MLQQRDESGATLVSTIGDNEIAIVGLACRFAGARDARDYWANLRGGVESIVPLADADLLAAGVDPRLLAQPNYVKAGAPLPDMDCFDASLFGLSPRDAAIMDPQHRHFLQCAWAAFEDAGHDPTAFAGAIGVFAGSGHNAYLSYNLLTNRRLVRDVGLFLLRHTGNDKDFLSTRLSYLLDLKGPSVNVQTACSTSLVAVHVAVQSLLNGECDMALAGGVSIDLPHGQGYPYQEGDILSPDGHCRAFDAGAQGTVFGSGAGAVVLRRLADARDDRDHIYAVIKGSAVNNDGAGKVGYLAPGVDGQALAISEALSIAEVDARSISYVEAHGTGTPVGDPIEIAALTQAFAQDTSDTGYCAIGSVKPNIGHTDTAAGVASLIKVALSFEHGELPPSLHHQADNPACDFARTPFVVNAALKPWPRRSGAPRYAGVSSLGVGGTNAHVVLGEAPITDHPGPSRPRQLIVLSAKSLSALDANSVALAEHFDAHPHADLADAAYTLSTGRRALPHRRILVAADAREAATLLRDQSADRVVTRECIIAGRPVAFLFAGGGAQHVAMGRTLYAIERVFAAAVDECFEELARFCDTDFRALLYPEPDRAAAAARALERPSIALPLLFTIQVALARLWASWGVRPAAMIGHSMGEYVAAHLAGVFTLGDALRIVSGRGRLFETVPPGAMLSVPLGEDDLRALLPPELSIAAINGRGLTVASGPVPAIDALQAMLAARAIETRRIPISVAAHSAMLAPILDDFRALLGTITLHAPEQRFVSNLTGDWIGSDEATDPEYWVRHLREPVRFTDGLDRLLDQPDGVLLEVGPGRVLSSLARQHVGRTGAGAVFNSLPHAEDATFDLDHMLSVAGQLWASGVAIDWHGYWRHERRSRVSLPSYRFDPQRHWIAPGAVEVQAQADPDEPLERRADLADWLYEPQWTRAALPPAEADGATALVFADALGLGDALAARLRAQGSDVALVRPGKRFHICKTGEFTVNPAIPADYQALVAHLSTRGRMPETICHLWQMTGDRRRRTAPRAIATAQDRGLFSLLYLAQALGENDPDVALHLMVVSDGTQRIADEAVPAPEKATSLGLVRVLGQEFPNIRARSIDLVCPPSSSARVRLAALLAAEAGATDDAETIAYRAAERWVQRIVATPAPVRADAPCTIRPEGVYLITGGRGGIGLTLARHLAGQYGARLALIGRSALPPRATWADHLARAPLDDPLALTLRQLLTIEAAGGIVLPITADVSDRGQMRRAVRTVRQQLGPINGVFHTAGCLDDGPLQLKTRAATEAVLTPKLHGTLALEQALAGERPDFLMLFSSVSAVAGLAGQVDYAAANAFLDAYAQARHNDDATRVISVGWSQWRDVGMAAALARQSDAEPALGPDTAMPIDHPLLTGWHRVSDETHVFTGQLSPATHWLLDEHRLTDGQALIPGTGFLEIARAAYAAIAPGPMVFSDVTFLAPFAVADGAARDIRVHLERRDASDWTLRIIGRSDAEAWQEHVRGTIAGLDAALPEPLDLGAIAARCDSTIPVDTIEHPPHLRFGARWQLVDRAQAGRGEALLGLTLPEAFRGDLTAMALHPALLDFATAGAQTLIPERDGSPAFFAPVSYGRVSLYAPLPGRIVSHIRLRPDGDASGALAIFDVTITDDAGTVLAAIADFTMLRLDDTAALHQSRAVAPAAKPRTTANDMVQDSQQQAMLPAEGMRVVEAILGGQGGAHILVSPHDLMPAIDRLRAPHRVRAADQGTPAALPAEAAPRTEAEALIAQMWGEMLGIDGGLGRSDDFFDLGGHSLLAVQFVNRLRKRTGKTVALGALIEASTVARLAAVFDPDSPVLDPDAVASDSPAADDQQPPQPALPGVTRLRAGNDPVSLFLVHDGLGETLLYRTLAFKLDGARSVYGLEPERNDDGQYRHSAISDMAAGHITRLRTLQPHGPYLLAGLCAGGVIAFEMARQLEDAGEAALFVGIIDAADVDAAERPFRVARARLHRARALFGIGAGSPPGLIPLVTALIRKVVSVMRYEIGSRIARLQQTRAVDRLGTHGGAARCDTAPPPDLGFLQIYEVAHRRHHPHGLFAAGDVVLFRAMQGNGAEDDMPFTEVYSDCILGWGKRVAGDVTMIPVPGGHTSVLQEPGVAVLATAMQERIDLALASYNPPDPALAPPPDDRARADAPQEIAVELAL
ncbi:type I polyketide synthase [Hephaestia sp. GCM10023244]|uniref:type I polyketide synthase n=1 Tax=unclassified Hephaestia TaxID=2631281 RepID=UPI0020772986|nr:type I polyketide synthase [Hephaestia sp. MAHUQ-44]MCM8731667.1 SDR family NAD(P)-dependent oxidoreductase [Hephaestia sp. MAHUQ-44]